MGAPSWRNTSVKSYQLKTFLAVASEGSFSKAARRVRVSQSTASLHVKELEESVGARLLDRGNGVVTATPAGQVMLAFAQRMLDLEQEARSKLRVHTDTPTGTLRIAASTVPAEVHLPRILASFTRRWPEVKVTVQVTDSDGAVDSLTKEGCDVAFVGKPLHRAGIVSRPFAEDEIVLVGAAGAADPDSTDFRLIVREDGSGTQAAAGEVVPHAVHPKLVVGSTEALRRCVLYGAGVAFLSRSVVEDDLAAHRLRIIPWPGTPVHRSLFVARLERTTPTSALDAFLALL
jgi:DNA-binding transcriptional LysR family regulator